MKETMKKFGAWLLAATLAFAGSAAMADDVQQPTQAAVGEGGAYLAFNSTGGVWEAKTAPVWVAKIGDQGYETIQAAVNAADVSAGPVTIKVMAGTHNETVDLNKSNLTFEEDGKTWYGRVNLVGEEGAVISGKITFGTGPVINVADVTFDGLTFVDTANPIYIDNSSGNTKNITIKNNTFNFNGNGPYVISAVVDGLTVTGNHFNCKAGNKAILGGAECAINDVTITGNTFEDWFGIYGQVLEDGVIVSGNTFSTTHNGYCIWINNNKAANVGKISISDNDFANTITYPVAFVKPNGKKSDITIGADNTYGDAAITGWAEVADHEVLISSSADAAHAQYYNHKLYLGDETAFATLDAAVAASKDDEPITIVNYDSSMKEPEDVTYLYDTLEDGFDAVSADGVITLFADNEETFTATAQKEFDLVTGEFAFGTITPADGYALSEVETGLWHYGEAATEVAAVISADGTTTNKFATLQAAVAAVQDNEVIEILVNQIELTFPSGKTGIIYRGQLDANGKPATVVTGRMGRLSGDSQLPLVGMTLQNFEFTEMVASPDDKGLTCDETVFDNCLFSGNNALRNVRVNDGHLLTITNCEFDVITYALHIDSAGGRVLVVDSTICGFCTYPPEPTLMFERCHFVDGTKTSYHVLQTQGSNLTVKDCDFSEKWCILNGYQTVGVTKENKIATLINCTVAVGTVAELCGNSEKKGLVEIDPVVDANGKYIGGTFFGSESMLDANIAADREKVVIADNTWKVQEKTVAEPIVIDIDPKQEGGAQVPVTVTQELAKEILGAGTDVTQPLNETQVMEIVTKLETKGEDGMTGWQKYTAGFSQTDKHPLAPKGKGTEDGKLVLVTSLIAPKQLSVDTGVKVKYILMQGSNVDSATGLPKNWDKVMELPTPEFPVDVTQLDPETYWKIEVEYTATKVVETEVEPEAGN